MSVPVIPNQGVPTPTTWTQNGAPPTFELVVGEAHIVANATNQGVRAHSLYDSEAGQTFHVAMSGYVVSGTWQFWAYNGGFFGPILSAGSFDVSFDYVSTSGGGGYLTLLSKTAPGEIRLNYLNVQEQSMAITSKGYTLTVTLVDSGNNKANLRFELTSADATEAAADAAAVIAALADVTNAVISRYSLAEVFSEDALTLPGAGVHVEDRATVICQLTSDPSKKVTVQIPAPVIGLFISSTGDGSNVVDVADADLGTYVALWHSGAEATISDGESIASSPNSGVVEGRRTHRASSYG